jgi:protein-disulfide isomerase
MKKISIVIILILIGAFLGGSLWSQSHTVKQQQEPTSRSDLFVETKYTPTEVPILSDPVQPNDHIRGNTNARYALIEYSDFECPFCKRFHSTAQEIINTRDDVVWIYRHFPLDSHPYALEKAIAAECVAELGGNDAFWEITDLLFSRNNEQYQQVLNALPSLAEQTGVERNAYEACIADNNHDQTIRAHQQSGIAAGIRGTPGILIVDRETGNGQLLAGALPSEYINEIIEQL